MSLKAKDILPLTYDCLLTCLQVPAFGHTASACHVAFQCLYKGPGSPSVIVLEKIHKYEVQSKGIKTEVLNLFILKCR